MKREVSLSYHDSLNYVNTRHESEEASDLIAEYLSRTNRLESNRLLFSRMPPQYRVRPLPIDIKSQYRLAYESPQNLALELSKSILYENADSIDVSTVKSLHSHDKQYAEDSLWNGKPQHYFESMNYADGDDCTGHCETDSLIV